MSLHYKLQQHFTEATQHYSCHLHSNVISTPDKLKNKQLNEKHLQVKPQRTQSFWSFISSFPVTEIDARNIWWKIWPKKNVQVSIKLGKNWAEKRTKESSKCILYAESGFVGDCRETVFGWSHIVPTTHTHLLDHTHIVDHAHFLDYTQLLDHTLFLDLTHLIDHTHTLDHTHFLDYTHFLDHTHLLITYWLITT